MMQSKQAGELYKALLYCIPPEYRGGFIDFLRTPESYAVEDDIRQMDMERSAPPLLKLVCAPYKNVDHALCAIDGTSLVLHSNLTIVWSDDRLADVYQTMNPGGSTKADLTASFTKRSSGALSMDPAMILEVIGAIAMFTPWGRGATGAAKLLRATWVTALGARLMSALLEKGVTANNSLNRWAMLGKAARDNMSSALLTAYATAITAKPTAEDAKRMMLEYENAVTMANTVFALANPLSSAARQLAPPKEGGDIDEDGEIGDVEIDELGDAIEFDDLEEYEDALRDVALATLGNGAAEAGDLKTAIRKGLVRLAKSPIVSKALNVVAPGAGIALKGVGAMLSGGKAGKAEKLLPTANAVDSVMRQAAAGTFSVGGRIDPARLGNALIAASSM